MTVRQLYTAPMEGITGYVWRNAHRSIFGGADRYYAPFLVPDANLRLQSRDLRELTQREHDLVPQVLTNRSDYFTWAARELAALGYGEVNLNLGCPSGTVVAKHKGSGMLRQPEELDRFLDGIFSAVSDVQISAKTRIGLNDPAEWPQILTVLQRYPFSALIVHPRLQKQQYGGNADRELFLGTMAECRLPLVYNGDVLSPEDAAFSYGCGVMVGRGLLRDPALLRQVQGGAEATRAELVQFHELLLEGYRLYMSGDLPLVHRMRELWAYLALAFDDTDAALKRMRKAKTLGEYRSAADSILHGCPLRSETDGSK